MERLPPSTPRVRNGRAVWKRRIRHVAFQVASFFTSFLCVATHSYPAMAKKVRVTGLADVDFSVVTNLQAENRRSQSICLFSNSLGGAYSIAVSGSGPGGSFALTNGPSALPYAVEWNQQSGQNSGTQLLANAPLTGQTSAATQQSCNGGPATSATLIVVLRAADLSQAQEGDHSGSLSVLIAAE